MSMLRNLIRWITVTKASDDDTSEVPVQQIEYLGKVANTKMIFPYGLYGNVPVGAFGVAWSIQGNPDNRVTMAWTPKNRPKLEAGEVAFYHPPTEAFMIWRVNGDLDIETGNGGGGNVNIMCSEANVMASTSITFDTPAATFTGDLTVDGDTALSSVVTSGGKDISDTHLHIGSPTAPTGSVSNTGAPL